MKESEGGVEIELVLEVERLVGLFEQVYYLPKVGTGLGELFPLPAENQLKLSLGEGSELQQASNPLVVFAKFHFLGTQVIYDQLSDFWILQDFP